jgi:long-chain fatty acid transport protein
VSPYVAWQFTTGQAIGVAPIIAYQRFESYGLQALDNPLLSNSVSSVTNRGHDDGWGVGIRAGYMAQVTATFAVSIAYASRISMSTFGAYQGLLAEGGGFDIPQSVLAGVAFRPARNWLLAVDYERIYYGQIPSLSNSSALLAACVQGQRNTCLGGSGGTGFGWRDIDVWRVGAQWKIDDKWTLRAGYSHSGNPIRSSDVTLNILAPAVVENHYSAGFSYRLDDASELTGAFTYAQSNSVTGPSLFTAFGAPPTTLDTISMKQYLVGAGYSRRF